MYSVVCLFVSVFDCVVGYLNGCVCVLCYLVIVLCWYVVVSVFVFVHLCVDTLFELLNDLFVC